MADSEEVKRLRRMHEVAFKPEGHKMIDRWIAEQQARERAAASGGTTNDKTARDGRADYAAEVAGAGRSLSIAPAGLSLASTED